MESPQSIQGSDIVMVTLEIQGSVLGGLVLGLAVLMWAGLFRSLVSYVDMAGWRTRGYDVQMSSMGT